jgi:glyoxalase family protein
MVHRIVWRIQNTEAVAFWHDRLTNAGCDPARTDDALRFQDPEGLEHELAIVHTPDEPLTANHPEIPQELALQGFHAVRAYSDGPGRSRALLEQTLGFEPIDPSKHGDPGKPGDTGASWEVRGDNRGGRYIYDTPPSGPTRKGAGTVHHVAWAAHPGEIDAWRTIIADAKAHPTPVIDRHYFRSVYFREPSGVLFELATIGPGFTVDEPIEHLGERLSLTPRFEELREQIEPTLTPLRNPRDSWAQHSR